MSRFFVNRTAIDENSGKIIITGDDVNHIKNVLRMAPGESIILCDCEGRDYNSKIDTISKDMVIAVIEDSVESITEPHVYITLFQGIPKSDKMDFVIQKSVELGVSCIVPVITERTVIKFDNERDKENKRTRWQRICLEAAKQCNRGIIPEVALPLKFAEAIKVSKSSDMSILPYEKETDIGIKSFLGSNRSIKSASVFIGPEGGFSEKEALYSFNEGVQPVTLGSRILRTETAGIAVMAIIMYELGDMG